MQRTAAIDLPDPDATTAFGARVSGLLAPGACLLLEGPIGAGKTSFARAVIHALLGAEEDVPSPTFTLVQTYEAPNFDIWHCDLYRLGSADELTELGVEEAFENAVTLIEWPDRLADGAPDDAVTLRFEVTPDDGRVATLSGTASWLRDLIQ